MIRWMLTDAQYQERFLRFLSRDIPRIRAAHAVSGMSSGDVPISSALERRIRDFYATDYTTFGYR